MDTTGRLTRFTPTFKPLTQITPFTYRGGYTFISLYEGLKDFLNNTLIGEVDTQLETVYENVREQVEALSDDVNTTKDEWETLFIQFMSDVTASLVAMNDTAVTDLVKDTTSRVRAALDEIYVEHENFEELTDTTVAGLVEFGSNTRNELDKHYLSTQRFEDEFDDKLGSGLANTLESAAAMNALDKNYDRRTRTNTKTMPGATAHDRLVNAIATGEPVQLDEHVEYAGNIPGFWDTTIYGTGKITLPGGETFTSNPYPLDSTTIVNTVYVNGQTGNNDHDGLTPDTALHTLSGVYRTVLRRLTAQQRNGARWVIRLSGDLVDGVEYFIDLGHFPHGLVFQGDEPRNGRPVTTIRKVNTSASRPFWIEPGIDAVEFYDLHFIGWGGTYGYAVYMRFGGELTVQRCEFSDGQYGAAAVQGLTYRFNDNIVNPSIRTGFLASYNSTGQFNRNTLTGGENSRYGIDVTRNTICHVDDNTITGYPQSGVYVDMASRASVDRNTFSKNGVGVTVAGGAEWTNNSNTFHRDNTSAFEHHGGGREMRMHSVGAWTGNEYRVAMTNRVYGTSQRTELAGWAIIYRGNTAGRLPGQWFQSRGKYIHARIHGHADKSGVVLELGTDLAAGSGYASFGNVTIPDAGYFTCDIYVYSTAVAAQRTFVTVNSANGSRTTSTTSSIDFHGDRNIMVRASRGANSVAVLTTYNMQVYALG